jgi:choloylglycine hydrolase
MFGCTSIHIDTKDGSPLYGRTLDYSVAFESALVVVPRRTRFQGTSPFISKNRRGKVWTSVYGYMGLNQNQIAVMSRWVVEGINERGLVASALYLSRYSVYENASETKVSDTIGCWEVVDLLLGTCASVKDVRERLSEVVVAQQNFPIDVDWITPEIHFHVIDANGHDIVIEYIDGRCRIYDNPNGVLTNDPPLEWQLEHFKSKYASLTPHRLPCSKTSPYCQNGNGLLGLPGDFTSVSRFVRASIFRRYAVTPRDATEGETLLWRIMDSFQLFPGIEILEQQQLNLTQWTVVYDLRKGKMAVRTHTKVAPRIFFLHQMDLDKNDFNTISITR